MKTEDTLGVALVKELCPICGKEMDGPIIMNKRLSKPNKKKVESMHNKVIGFADHCCDECSKYKKEGIFCIIFDDERSKKNASGGINRMEDFYRVGYACIRKDSSFTKMLRDNKLILELEDKTQYCFIEQKFAKNLGLC